MVMLVLVVFVLVMFMLVMLVLVVLVLRVAGPRFHSICEGDFVWISTRLIKGEPSV